MKPLLLILLFLVPYAHTGNITKTAPALIKTAKPPIIPLDLFENIIKITPKLINNPATLSYWKTFFSLIKQEYVLKANKDNWYPLLWDNLERDMNELFTTIAASGQSKSTLDIKILLNQFKNIYELFYSDSSMPQLYRDTIEIIIFYITELFDITPIDISSQLNKATWSKASMIKITSQELTKLYQAPENSLLTKVLADTINRLATIQKIDDVQPLINFFTGSFVAPFTQALTRLRTAPPIVPQQIQPRPQQQYQQQPYGPQYPQQYPQQPYQQQNMPQNQQPQTPVYSPQPR
jgi:hypothetical protein